MLARRQIAVIYDATCGFCSKSVRLLERLDWRHRVSGIPNQTAGITAALGLSREQLESTAWAISPGGHRYRGHHAVAAALDALLPFGIPLFRPICSLPGISWLLARAYGWVERNRHRLPFGPPHMRPGRPYPALPIPTLLELERRSTRPRPIRLITRPVLAT